MPLIIFPIVLSSLADALVALGRISTFLSAEELPEPYVIDDSLKSAVQVDGDFTWETAGKLPEDSKLSPLEAKAKEAEDKKAKEKAKKDKKDRKGKDVLPVAAIPEEPGDENDKENAKDEEKPFELKNLKLSVPKGSFVAIVGRIGSGKVRNLLFHRRTVILINHS